MIRVSRSRTAFYTVAVHNGLPVVRLYSACGSVQFLAHFDSGMAPG